MIVVCASAKPSSQNAALFGEERDFEQVSTLSIFVDLKLEAEP